MKNYTQDISQRVKGAKIAINVAKYKFLLNKMTYSHFKSSKTSHFPKFNISENAASPKCLTVL